MVMTFVNLRNIDNIPSQMLKLKHTTLKRSVIDKMLSIADLFNDVLYSKLQLSLI